MGSLFNVPLYHLAESVFIQSTITEGSDKGNYGTVDHTNSFSMPEF
jgi:hypothetical protein